MTTLYWQEELETLQRDHLEQLQVKRLRTSIALALQSPFYRSRYEPLQLSEESINTIADIQKLPFTTKDDLRDAYPFGLLTCPKAEVVRMHCTSGTTGNPAAILHNRHDLDSWANLMARSMFAAGARPDDIFQNMSGYGLFTGGLGFQNGAEVLGCLTIPAAAGNSRRQIKLMQDFGTTVVHSVPSYLGRLHAVFQENGLDPRRDTKLQRLFIGAEPHSEETRLRLQELFGAKAYNSFGMTEMNGPGVAFECACQNGMHLWEDSYVLEILNPDTMTPVPDGEIGELVLTTLDRQAMPILRYRTRDLTRIIPEPCPCGRTARRIDRIKGRTDDMFIVKGCNVFPIQIEQTLMKIPQIGSDYMIIIDSDEQGDKLIVQAELSRELKTDDYKQLEAIRKQIGNNIKDEILFLPIVQLLSPGEIPRNEGKAVRVQDKRKK